ncbi:MAG: hypothetical protein JNM45_15270 [Rhizobiales bacterium]|nr:hypothetical protein [Hyphomicrobiales bacterium]
MAFTAEISVLKVRLGMLFSAVLIPGFSSGSRSGTLISGLICEPGDPFVWRVSAGCYSKVTPCPGASASSRGHLFPDPCWLPIESGSFNIDPLYARRIAFCFIRPWLQDLYANHITLIVRLNRGRFNERLPVTHHQLH